jgi:hypothetical protein
MGVLARPPSAFRQQPGKSLKFGPAALRHLPPLAKLTKCDLTLMEQTANIALSEQQ